ncbi:hypothetical protein LCGC14_1279170, partial [marine sediment metagenome]
KRIVIFVTILLVISLGLNLRIPFSYAQENEQIFHSNFVFHEYSEIFDVRENISSLNIEFPEMNWNITDININFTNIRLGSEVKDIETMEFDTGLVDNLIYRQNPTNKKRLGLAVQLEIQEPTTLYGVFIRGRKSNTSDIIHFQIRGYDEIDNKPNSTIYRSVNLNMSYSLDQHWYYQNFSLSANQSNPIELQTGNYSLVMIGNESLSNVAQYYWSVNDVNPAVPNLHTSEFIDSWNSGITNTSFLHRLHRKTEKIYNPQDINITAEIGGKEYEIFNGASLGSGLLEINDLSYFLNDTILHVPIKGNNSVQFIFNCSYLVKLTSSSFSEGDIKVKKNSNIKWTILPQISRISNKYSFEFNFPKEWFNIVVYRKIGGPWENVTSFVDINNDEKTITIPNSVILNGSNWKIEADSQNAEFNINFPIKEWERGQSLQFSITDPIINGEFIFFLINPAGFGFEEPIDTKEGSSGEIVFNYSIPSNAIEGTYSVFIYWNNQTHAGVQSEEFTILIPTIPFSIDPWIIVLVIFIVSAIFSFSLLSYRGIKKLRGNKIEKAQKVYNQCIDILNLDYLMVTDKKSGLNVYTQSLTGNKIDATLISGFLQAIHSFGIELMKVEDRSQTIKLEYQNSIIIMSEFVNLRLILIMKESPSRFFLYAIDDLAYDIFKNYGDQIQAFNGDVHDFDGISELIKHHLNISFVSPLRVLKTETLAKVRLNQSERSYVNKAVYFMKVNNLNHFFIRDIISIKECNPKDVEIILNLLSKKIFHPSN